MGYRASRFGEGRRLVKPGTPWWWHVASALAVVATLVLAVAAWRLLAARWQDARFQARGVTYGPPPPAMGQGVDPWGVNVALEQYPGEALSRSLDLLASAGFRWVRQRFPWAEIEPARGDRRWERWDGIVRQCQRRGLHIIAVLDGSPAWARGGADAANPYAPPRNPADLAAFARAFAARYGPVIDHYQVWDEPNIYPHWGERDPDPAGYLSLLRAARTQIRDVDPGALVVAAGLAPTTEERGRNLSDLLFLRGLYQAGGRELFDAAAAKPYGFWSDADDRRVEAGVLNFSRLVAQREEMVRQGDGDKPLWAVAWGWNALPEGWRGQPSPWGTDAPSRQHERDLEAIERARQEWPWLRLMCYAAWQPLAPADDPAWGLALLDAQGVPGPLYDRLQALALTPGPLYPGRHPVSVPAAGGPALELGFWGSRVDLVGDGRWRLVELDGRALGRTLAGRGATPVTAVRGLEAGEHRLLLEAAGPAAPVTVVISRERPPWVERSLLVALAAGVVVAGATLFYLLRPYPWRRWFRLGLQAYRQLPPWQALAVGGVGLGLVAFSPGLGLSLAALGVLALLVGARADVGLGLGVFLVPLAPLHKRFGPAQFSYLEMVTLLTVAGVLLGDARTIFRSPPGRPLGRALASRLRQGLRQLQGLDVGFALLVGTALLSLWASQWLWVSLRELRVVVLQAALLYALVVRLRPDRDGVLRLVDLLVASAAVVSLQGLFQYGWTERVVVVEGVRRIRGIYGSPNNLALVLGRALPLMLAMVLCGPRGRRRWAYAAAAALGLVCFFLTFSRGGWVLGLPAALLVLAVLAGRRPALVALALLAVAAVALVPLVGTERFASLFSGQGTTLLRLKLWEAAWEMARDHPVLGVGLDNFLYHYPRYIRPEALSEPNLSHPHNVVLDFWLRLGLPGLAAFAWLEWCYFQSALRLWRERADPALWAVSVGLIAGMVDMLAHGLIDASFFVVELAGLTAVMAGLVRVMERPGPPDREHPR